MRGVRRFKDRLDRSSAQLGVWQTPTSGVVWALGGTRTRYLLNPRIYAAAPEIRCISMSELKWLGRFRGEPVVSHDEQTDRDWKKRGGG